MESRQKLREAMAFHKAAHDAVKNKHSADFICTKCGGTAHAAKFKHNGHVWANCEGCGFSVME